MTKISAAKDLERNVWLQLGMPDAEEYYLKAELVLRLHRAIKASSLTQRAAARRIGATQPELSKILRGKFSRRRGTVHCGVGVAQIILQAAREVFAHLGRNFVRCVDEFL